MLVLCVIRIQDNVVFLNCITASLPVQRFIMPELVKGFLLTNRIKALHKHMNECCAGIICAPAGYGKTTLAISYFSRMRAQLDRICWYRLGIEARDPSTFAGNLIDIIFPADDKQYVEARQDLANKVDLQSQPLLAIAMLCQELWMLDSDNENVRTYIVFDDFEAVADVPDICALIRLMVDNLPLNYAIHILSRTWQYVFTEKQKLEKPIFEINAVDLRFDVDEIEALMRGRDEPAPEQALVQAISQVSEGWIAAITIMWQALKHNMSKLTTIQLSRLEPGNALFRYMSEEIMRDLDDETRQSLIRLSLLDQFTENEASAILEINNVQLIMEDCIKAGMFIHIIPDDPVVFRFHSLFREFLYSILKDLVSTGQLADLHYNAARYYVQQKAWGIAVEHIVQCGKYAPVVELVAEVGLNGMMLANVPQFRA